MMKLGTVISYLKDIKKFDKSRDTPLYFWRHYFFPSKIINFHHVRLHINSFFLILLTFFVSLRIVSINMIVILMIPAKLATPGLKIEKL